MGRAVCLNELPNRAQSCQFYTIASHQGWCLTDTVLDGQDWILFG